MDIVSTSTCENLNFQAWVEQLTPLSPTPNTPFSLSLIHLPHPLPPPRWGLGHGLGLVFPKMGRVSPKPESESANFWIPLQLASNIQPNRWTQLAVFGHMYLLATRRAPSRLLIFRTQRNFFQSRINRYVKLARIKHTFHLSQNAVTLRIFLRSHDNVSRERQC